MFYWFTLYKRISYDSYDHFFCEVAVVELTLKGHGIVYISWLLHKEGLGDLIIRVQEYDI